VACNSCEAVIDKDGGNALLQHQLMKTKGCIKCDIKHCAQAGVMKAAITCLGQVTAAVDPSQWPGAVRPFGLLLQLLLDERPKVRKRAQDAAQSVLAALRDTSARQPASDAVLKSESPSICSLQPSRLHLSLFDIAGFLC